MYIHLCIMFVGTASFLLALIPVDSCMGLLAHLFICMYVWVCTYGYVRMGMYVCMYICMYVCMYPWVYPCMYPRMYPCMHTCACIYVCVYACTVFTVVFTCIPTAYLFFTCGCLYTDRVHMHKCVYANTCIYRDRERNGERERQRENIVFCFHMHRITTCLYMCIFVYNYVCLLVYFSVFRVYVCICIRRTQHRIHAEVRHMYLMPTYISIELIGT